MTLLIPSQKSPGDKSFPTSPEAVEQWLNSVLPINDAAAIRQLYRGLKHTNRLENTVLNRERIAGILEPSINAAVLMLEAQFLDQSLPLPRKSRHSHQLATEMLQEQAFMHKIIVDGTYTTSQNEQIAVRQTGILNALQALARLLEAQIRIMGSVPQLLLNDANTLFRLAAASNLNTKTGNAKEPAAKEPGVAKPEDNLRDIENVYIYIQLLTLSSPNNQRRRQIPLLFSFLTEQSRQLKIQTVDDGDYNANNTFGIFLSQDGRPQPVKYTGNTNDGTLRLLDISAMLDNLESLLNDAPDDVGVLHEAETLSKQTLVALRESLQRRQQRKLARAITRKMVSAKTGLHEITASLHYSPGDIQLDSEKRQSPARAPDSWPKPVTNLNKQWVVLNENRFGACLEWRDQHMAETEVGELVAWRTDNTNDDTAWMIGIVRWLNLEGTDRLLMGIEYFAQNAQSITLNIDQDDDPQSTRNCLLTNESPHSGDEFSLIAPPAVYQENDGVKTGEETRYQIIRKISTTPACDFFTVREVS